MNAEICANFLIYILSEAVNDLTSLKLNSLLYYSQGHYLTMRGKPLFSDRIEARGQGAIVPDVYARYKVYGDDPISDYNLETASLVPKETEEILFAVARKYGRYTESELRDMVTAAGSPWDLVYQPDQKPKEIPASMMRQYFSEFESLDFTVREYSEADFIGYRDDDGFLVLPKDWDDGLDT